MEEEAEAFSLVSKASLQEPSLLSRALRGDSIIDHQNSRDHNVQDGRAVGDDSTASPSINSKKKVRKARKKSFYRSGVNPFPRIIKSDIKRGYPAMIVNASNSCDWDTIFSFYNLYFAPDCVVSKNAKHPVTGNLIPLKKHHGVMDFLTNSHIQGMPVDSTFQMLKATITRLACNTGSTITITLKVKSCSLVQGIFIAHHGTFKALEVLEIYERVLNRQLVDLQECVLVSDIILRVGDDNIITQMDVNAKLAIERG